MTKYTFQKYWWNKVEAAPSN